MISLASSLPIAPLANAWEWFQPPSSTGAADIDWLFWFITWICVFFFVLIIGLMGWFMWVYRARPGYKAEHSAHHNNTLEAAWSIIPLLLVVAIFFLGADYYFDSRNAPGDAYEINVKAQKWSWAFVYPNGVVDTNLHVPVDTPVKLVMSSSDVLHSLYIPAFRVKMDVVPGKYTSLWFHATQATQDDNEDQELAYFGDGEGMTLADFTREDGAHTGGFDLFCTEYCGTGHSNMFAKVIVHESGGFEKWMAKALDPRSQGTPVEVGQRLYSRRGCAQCHTIDGKDNPANGGPSFKGHYGKSQAFADGSEHVVDENYIRESILNPMAKIRKGYRPIMPTFQGQLSEDQIFALIQYIKSLNDKDVEDWAPLPEEEATEAQSEPPPADGDAADGDEEPSDEPNESEEADAEETTEDSE